MNYPLRLDSLSGVRQLTSDTEKYGWLARQREESRCICPSGCSKFVEIFTS